MMKRKQVLFASFVLFVYSGVGTVASPSPTASPPSSSHDTTYKNLPQARTVYASFTQRINGLEVFVAETISSFGGPDLTYEWDFGDGSMGAGETARHTYAHPGVYNIRLKACTVATDSVPTECGEVYNTIGVAELPTEGSSVDLRGPYGGVIGEEIRFKADRILAVGANYYWEFGDGAKAKGRTVYHSYDAVGSYTVTLTVESALNKVLGTGTTTATVVLGDVPPVVVGVGPREGIAGEAIGFDATGTNDPNGGALSFEWDFGDGTPIVSDIKTTHVYSNPGAYMASLVVVEADSSVHGNLIPVTVSHPAVIDDHGDDFDVATFTKVLARFGGVGSTGWLATGNVFGDIEIRGDKDIFKATFTSGGTLQSSASAGVSRTIFKREVVTDCTASPRPLWSTRELAPVCAYHPESDEWLVYANGSLACHNLAVEKHFPSNKRTVKVSKVSTDADCSDEVINDEPLKVVQDGDLLVPGDYYTVVEGIDDFHGVYQFELIVGGP